MDRRQLWQAPVVVVLGLLLAGLVGLIAVNAPEDPTLRRDQALLFSGPLPANQKSPPSTGTEARQLAGVSLQSLPHDWQFDETPVSEAWYFFDLDIARHDDWSVWIPRVAMNARLWLNGEPLALRGQLADPLSRYWNQPWLVALAPDRLNEGSNLLAIQVVAERAGRGLLREIYVGPDESLRIHHQANLFFSVQLLQMIVLLMLLSAVFMALLWRWGQRDPAYGSYAVMMLAWAIHDIYPLVTNGSISALALDWFWHVTLTWFVYSVCVFVFRFLQSDERELERRFLLWSVASTVLLTLSAALSPVLFYDWAMLVCDTVTLIVSGYPMWCVIRARMRGGPEDLSLMIPAGSFALVFGIHDWMFTAGIAVRDVQYLMPYGSLAIMLVIGILLTRRFGVALRTLADVNQSLEVKLRQREQEIAAAHQRLLKLETERAVLDERERLVRDMHDGLGGTLVSTLAMVRAGEASQDRLQEALQTAIEDMRLMIDSLDPVDGDLVSVLASLRSRLTPRLSAAGLRVDWQVNDLPALPWLGPQGVLSVMRVLQEAINNVLKHARASVIEVSCGYDEQARLVWVRLADDGVGLGGGTARGGIGDSAAEIAAFSGGRGLANMKQRAAALGAGLSVGPRPGGGTLIVLQLPVSRSDHSRAQRGHITG